MIKVVRKWALSSCHLIATGINLAPDNDSPTDSECTAGLEDEDEKEKKVTRSPFFGRQISNKYQSDDESLDAEVESFNVDKIQQLIKMKVLPESLEKSPDDFSEDDFKSEDERLPTDEVGMMSNELLKSWSMLKVIRITFY